MPKYPPMPDGKDPQEVAEWKSAVLKIHAQYLKKFFFFLSIGWVFLSAFSFCMGRFFATHLAFVDYAMSVVWMGVAVFYFRKFLKYRKGV